MPKPLATWNPARGVWEVPQTENLLCEHSDVYSAPWPTSGTTRHGTAYVQPTSAHHTGGSGSSSLPGLLPTPTARDPKNVDAPGRMGGMSLAHMASVELLPTPDATHGRKTTRTSLLLPGAVEALLPTPNASVSQDGESFETWEARRQVALTKGYNGNGIGMPLTIAVQLLPTPRASDGTKGGPNQRGSSGDLMLPSAVTSIGAPTPPPSPDGPQSWDVPLPLPPS